MNRKRVLYVSVLIIVTTLSVLIATQFFQTPSSDSFSEEDILRGSGNHNDLVQYYLDQLSIYPDSVKLHRSLIESYESIGVNFQPTSVPDYYDQLESSGKDHNICNYIKGYHYAVRGYSDSALFYYNKVTDSSLPFLQNSLGVAYAEIDKDSLASIHFLNSISLNDNPEYSAYHLSKLFYRSKQYDKLNILINDEYLSNYVSLRIRRFSHLENYQYIDYLKNFIYVNFGNVVPEGFLAGVLILFVWIGYLLRIDIFQKKKVFIFFCTFLLGAIFSLGCTVLYDIFDLQFNLALNGTYINDLVFSIIGIGLIEESVKIAPLLLLLSLIKRRCIDEPLDYIVLASLSALGFAFMENIGYFHIYGLNTIFARAQSASLLHMFFTVLPIYGIIRGVKLNRNGIFQFIIYFTISILIHGIYDFFLVGEKGVHQYRQFAPIILIISIGLFQRIILHMLNISTSYDFKRLEKLNHLSYYLGYSLFSVFILQFFIVANRFGSEAAVNSLPINIYTSLFPLFVIPMILGKFVICRGYLPSLLSPKQFKMPQELLIKYSKDWNKYTQFHNEKQLIFKNRLMYLFSSIGKLLLMVLYISGTMVLLQKSQNLRFIYFGISIYFLLSILFAFKVISYAKSMFLSITVDFITPTLQINSGKRIIGTIDIKEVKKVKQRGKSITFITPRGRYILHCKNNQTELYQFYHHLKRYLISINESLS